MPPCGRPPDHGSYAVRQTLTDIKNLTASCGETRAATGASDASALVSTLRRGPSGDPDRASPGPRLPDLRHLVVARIRRGRSQRESSSFTIGIFFSVWSGAARRMTAAAQHLRAAAELGWCPSLVRNACNSLIRCRPPRNSAARVARRAPMSGVAPRRGHLGRSRSRRRRCRRTLCSPASLQTLPRVSAIVCWARLGGWRRNLKLENPVSTRRSSFTVGSPAGGGHIAPGGRANASRALALRGRWRPAVMAWRRMSRGHSRSPRRDGHLGYVGPIPFRLPAITGDVEIVARIGSITTQGHMVEVGRDGSRIADRPVAARPDGGSAPRGMPSSGEPNRRESDSTAGPAANLLVGSAGSERRPVQAYYSTDGANWSWSAPTRSRWAARFTSGCR